MMNDVQLRPVRDEDLPIFFEHQQDPEAVQMAAFTHRDPNDRAAFDAHWAKLRTMPSVRARTIVLGDVVVGNVGSYEHEGLPEVTYWIGRAYWGRGLATAALRALLLEDTRRPMYGHAAKDNAASRRVMVKCGFKETGESLWYANARGKEIEEVALVLA